MTPAHSHVVVFIAPRSCKWAGAKPCALSRQRAGGASSGWRCVHILGRQPGLWLQKDHQKTITGGTEEGGPAKWFGSDARVRLAIISASVDRAGCAGHRFNRQDSINR